MLAQQHPLLTLEHHGVSVQQHIEHRAFPVQLDADAVLVATLRNGSMLHGPPHPTSQPTLL